VDGLGIGKRDGSNPLHFGDYPGLRRLAGGVSPAGLEPGGVARSDEACLVAVDATFGVPGLPQSASGQTALLSGEKAPLIVGRHVNAFPTRALRTILAERNILKHFVDRGFRATFLNAYRRLDENGRPLGKRLSCTTVATMAAGVDFRTLDSLRQGTAVLHDITGENVKAQGFDVPVRTPGEAARAAAGVIAANDLTLFEYFITDIAGHSGDAAKCAEALGRLDKFVSCLLDDLDPDDTLVVLSSDHGNIEDLTTRSHTRNPVPFAIWGGRPELRERMVSATTDIAGVPLAIQDAVI
jgi:hypothetical protein